VLAGGVVWWGVFTALTAAAPSGLRMALVWFIAMRFLLGAGEAVMFPASNQFVSRWIPAQERGLANGLIFCWSWSWCGSFSAAYQYLCFITDGGLRFGFARWPAWSWVCLVRD